MEVWLLLGILAYFSYAVSSSLDRFLMRKGLDPVGTNTFKMGLDALILLVLGSLFFDLKFASRTVLWGAVIGLLYAVAGVLYFKALKVEDAERAIPFMQSGAVLLVFVASVMFLNESVNVFNWAGVFLILIGIYALFMREKLKLPDFGDAGLFILGNILLITAFSLVSKYVISGSDPLTLAVMMYAWCAFFLYAYHFTSRKGVIKFREPLIPVTAFFGAVATFMLFSALSLANASKVFPLAGAQSAFVFVIATIFLKEKFSFQRLAGVVVIVAGIFLVSI